MKIPKARRLKGGSWYVYLRLNGKGYGVTAATEKDAVRKAQLFKAEWLAGNKKSSAGDLTLREAIDRYIDMRTLSPSTVRGYKSIEQNRFVSVIDKPLSRITEWERLVKDDLRSHTVKSAKNAWYLICSVLKANGLTYPEINFPPAAPPEPRYLTAAEIKTFVSAIKGTEVEIAALLALHSLRRSEIMALTWDHVDLAKGLLRIRGAVVYDEAGQLTAKKENKNATSTRTIKIMIPELAEALAAVLEKTGRVVTCSPDVIRRRVNAVCKDAGLPLVGTHGLRHSFASLAHHVGLSEQETMEIGGWKDIYTMRKIYQHLERADRLTAENKMAAWYAAK